MDDGNTPIMDAATQLAEASGLNITPRAAVQQLLQTEALLVMDEVGTLDSVVFQGGSSIVRCYDGVRMSEDLDFRMASAVTVPEITEVADTLTRRVRSRLGTEPEVKIRGFEAADPKHTSCLTIKTSVSTNKAAPKVMTKLDFDALPVMESVLRPCHSPIDALRGISMPNLLAKTPDELVADKVTSAALTGLAGRRNPRTRDAFDICWLFDRYSLDLQAVGEMARLKAADYGHEEGDLAEGIRAFCASISNDGFSPITSLEPMMWVDATYERLLDPQAAHDLVLRFAGVCSVALGEPSLRAMPSVPKPRRGV